SADQDNLAGEVAGDHRLGPRAMALRIGLERRQIHDGQIRDEGHEILGRRTNQQVADEQRVPGEFGEDARLDAEGRLGARIKILGDKRHALGMGEEVAAEMATLNMTRDSFHPEWNYSI